MHYEVGKWWPTKSRKGLFAHVPLWRRRGENPFPPLLPKGKNKSRDRINHSLGAILRRLNSHKCSKKSLSKAFGLRNTKFITLNGVTGGKIATNVKIHIFPELTSCMYVKYLYYDLLSYVVLTHS